MGNWAISHGLYLAIKRPIYGRYMAFIWPLSGFYTAAGQPLYGPYMAFIWPLYGGIMDV